MKARDLLIGALEFYQRGVSPYLGANCRFIPSCSEYMIVSVRENGCVLGTIDGFWRILRCHPFHPGGVDEPGKIRIF